MFIPNVRLSVANQVLSSLNKAGANERRTLEVLEEREHELYAGGYVDKVYRRWLEEMDGMNQIEMHVDSNLTLGYVTTDVRTSFFLQGIVFTNNSLDSLVQE